MSLSGSPPNADVEIDAALVHRLLTEQHPDLASSELRLAAEGWDNMTFRLGDDLAVRLPRRELAANLIRHEQRWLPELAPHLPIPIPAPIRIGTPSDLYPWSWSVIAWIPGETALDAPPRPEAAAQLGGFLRALHDISLPDDPPANPFRGGPLSERTALIEARVTRMNELLPEWELAPLLEEQLSHFAMAPGDAPPVWLHGDLHPKNVIIHDGRLAAVVDWGDICSGDPATDLAALWCLFDVPHHRPFWDEYGDVSEATRQRARGWALSFGLMHWDAHHVAEPRFAASGLETMKRALSG